MVAEFRKSKELLEQIRTNDSQLQDQIRNLSKTIEAVSDYLLFLNENSERLDANYEYQIYFDEVSPITSYANYDEWESRLIELLPYPKLYMTDLELQGERSLEDWAEENLCWGTQDGDGWCDSYMAWYHHRNPGQHKDPDWYTADSPSESDNRKWHEFQEGFLKAAKEAKEEELSGLLDYDSEVKFLAEEVCNSRGLYD